MSSENKSFKDLSGNVIRDGDQIKDKNNYVYEVKCDAEVCAGGMWCNFDGLNVFKDGKWCGKLEDFLQKGDVLKV